MWKRILAAILSICIVFTMLPMTSFAEEANDIASGSCGTDVIWTLTDDGTLTISGSGAMQAYKMGEWQPSTNVETPWYGSRENITRVVIEDGVTSVGDYAFCGCVNVTEIILPDYMSEIGMAAFRECSKLSHIRIPEGVKFIERSTFLRCSNLQEVILPDSVKTLENYAFEDCISLQEFIIPNSVEIMEPSVFMGCSNLKRVVMSTCIKNIDNFMFSGCSSLQEVVIPEGIEYIGIRAFENCSSLQEIVIPEGVMCIDRNAFSGCSSLQETVIPESVTKIGGNAFSGCSGLQRAVISSGVTTIEHHLFSRCSNLKHVSLSEKVTKIGWNAFEGCGNLQEIIIPENITEIGAYAFAGCSSLPKVDISENITEIKRYTFEGCSGLQEVIIPKSVTEIGDGAFYECGSLKQLLVPASVITIGSGAFAGNKNISLVGAKGSAIEAYAKQNNCNFTEHAHEWNDGDKSNLSCANNKVPYACMGCGAVEEREIPVAHDEIAPAEDLGDVCTGAGNAIYYKCTRCGRYFLDASGNTEISRREIEIAVGHELSKVEGKPATCKSGGSIEHYKCEKCGKLFRDAGALEEISEDDIIIEKLVHSMMKTEGVPATCESGGNIEYYQCESCDKLFRDVNGLEEITLDDVGVEKLSHSIVKVQAKPATCESEGNIEYYRCENCGKLFRDANGLEEITLDDVSVEKLSHGIVKVQAKPATCESEGNIEYYQCESCKRLFRDEEGLEEITVEDIVTKATEHSLRHVAAKAPTCTERGNVEYFYCGICNKKFSDASGKQQISEVEVNPLEHKYEVVTKKATLSADGGVTNVCVYCGRRIAVSTYYKISTVKLSKDAYQYTGKVQAPKVTVVDSRGNKISPSNYTVSYAKKKSKNIGKYKVSVKFKGKIYSGDKTLYYTILPVNVTLKSVFSNSNGELTAKWGRNKGIDGYQIRYSRKSNFKGSKTKTVKGAKTKQYTIRKLAKGKKYYVQVRNYKKVSGKTYYGAWSKKKSTKTLNMRLNYKSLSLEPGQTRTLKLVGARKAIKWTTSNSAVANVNSAGRVTAVADGTATITATCGGGSYSCIVRVKTVTTFDKLYNYINDYGSVNSAGNRFVRHSFYLDGDLWSIGIIYDKNEGQFTFSCFDPDRIVTTMSIGRNGSTTGKCEFICSAYFGGCIAYADVNVPTYTEDSILKFNLETYDGGTWEQYDRLANLQLKLGMRFWDVYLKKNLGFGMSGLGFTSY